MTRIKEGGAIKALYGPICYNIFWCMTAEVLNFFKSVEISAKFIDI
jgi:hypothetical protein